MDQVVRIKKVLFEITIFTILVLSSCGAFGQDNSGYLLLDHGRIGQINPIIPEGISDVAVEKKDGWALGLGFGYRFELLAIEAFYRTLGTISYKVPGFYDEAVKSNALGQGIRYWYNWLSINAGILSVRSERTTTSEVGSSNSVTRDNMEKAWTSSGYFAGAGVSLDLTSSIDLYMDVTYYTWGGDSENVTVVSGSDTHTSKTSDRYKLLEFLLGIRFYL